MSVRMLIIEYTAFQPLSPLPVVLCHGSLFYFQFSALIGYTTSCSSTPSVIWSYLVITDFMFSPIHSSLNKALTQYSTSLLIFQPASEF